VCIDEGNHRFSGRSSSAAQSLIGLTKLAVPPLQFLHPGGDVTWQTCRLPLRCPPRPSSPTVIVRFIGEGSIAMGDRQLIDRAKAMKVQLTAFDAEDRDGGINGNFDAERPDSVLGRCQI
jgi:hypothetical protein